MSSRIAPVEPTLIPGRTQDVLATIKSKLGMVPNAIKTMANSPALLEGYVSLSGALNHGILPVQLREQVALTISQANRCEYCLSSHSVAASRAGLNPDQIRAARRGQAENPKAQAVLNLVQNIMERRGNVSDEQLADARKAGVTDAEISEVVGNVALTTLTNYFNMVARTDIDFPRVLINV